MVAPRIYFEKLIESSPDIVVAVDRQGTIVFYNDGAHKTLGYTQGEVIGKHVTLLYPSLSEAKRVMAHARPDGYTVGWNVHPVGGQTVPHAHLHVIGRFADEPLAGKGLRHALKQPENRRPGQTQ